MTGYVSSMTERTGSWRTSHKYLKNMKKSAKKCWMPHWTMSDDAALRSIEAAEKAEDAARMGMKAAKNVTEAAQKVGMAASKVGHCLKGKPGGVDG